MENGDWDYMMHKPVTLNVGGHLYTTAMTTLQRYPDSMLGAMFCGDLPTTRDSQGNYFIDRDGTLFHYILNFLRTSELILPVDFMKTDLLRKEADFYQIEPLIQCLNNPKPAYPPDTFEQMTKPVTLNVGGHLYTTTLSTLQRYPDSMLGAMFCGDLPTTRDSQGNYFIDRDGTLFHYILNFLRTSELILPVDFMKTDLLRKEADFYQIEPLIQCLNNPKPAYPPDTFEQMTKPVTLNVGGHLYTTTMSTLQRYPDSMLGGMFRGDLPTARDAQGNYFIDRDGTLFRYILNFLRTSELILPVSFTELDLLRKEADFYQIEPLIHSLNDPKPLYSLDAYEQMTKPVTLNVGGHMYTTTLSTLQRYPDSMLGAMFRGDLPTTRDAQGNYFIDRDGTLFRFVLNFLRSSEFTRPLDFTEMELLRKEADFYQIEPLIHSLNDTKPPYPLDTYEQVVELSSTRKLSKYSNPVAVIITQLTITTKVHALLEGISNNFTKWNKHMMDTRDCQVSFTFGPCDYHQEVALRVHLMDYITKQGFIIRNTRVHHMSERANENTVEHNWTFCRPAYKVED